MAIARPLTSVRSLALKNDSAVARAFWIATFTILTGIGAQFEIAHQPVPYTLQTLFVILAGGMLGKRDGALSMILYVVLGLFGLPVFSGGGFGVARLIGPTGGYILAFPAAAYVVGSIIERLPDRVQDSGNGMIRLLATYGWLVGGMGAGLLLIFSVGTAHLNLVYFHNWKAAFQSGFLIFSWWDLLKLGAAAMICREFRR